MVISLAHLPATVHKQQQQQPPQRKEDVCLRSLEYCVLFVLPCPLRTATVYEESELLVLQQQSSRTKELRPYADGELGKMVIVVLNLPLSLSPIVVGRLVVVVMMLLHAHAVSLC